MKNKYELIIFDCDGTLVDTEELINFACSDVLTKMGYPQYTHEYCLKHFSSYGSQVVIDRLWEDLGPSFDVKGFEKECFKMIKENVAKNAKPMEHANMLLEHIQEYPKCVASNGNREWVLSSLTNSGLIKYFNEMFVFTYEDVGKFKPEPDLFLFAARTMGYNPYECLVIEDSIVGVKAAKAAGMDVIGLKSPYRKVEFNLEAENPTGIVSNLSEIINFIK